MPSSSANKNIVVCCDGTGNQFGENNSNVVKLYTALTVNNEQAGYYHPGVGTMGAPQARSKLAKAWSVMAGLAFAAGFMEHVEDAYRYLMDTYNDGDRIYLFGFSRGSYTARALAAVLHGYGLLCRGNEGQIPYVFKMFYDEMNAVEKENKQRRERGVGEAKTSLTVARAFKETFCHDVTLRFVGLWDTVSSVGWITQPLRLLYSAQNPIIQTGRHAVSIDERRCMYQDNLWGNALPVSETPTLGETVIEADGSVGWRAIPQDILQAWFPGVHSDVGGSYAQLESALANHALRWILEEAIANGLMVEEERVRLIFGLETEKVYAAAPLYVTPPEPGIVHRSLFGAWWLLEVLPHRYYVHDTDEEHWRIPLGSSRTLPTDAVVHPSAVERMYDEAAEYHPRNLAMEDLTPHPGRQWGTSANLTGWFLYKPGEAASRRQSRGAVERVAGAAVLLLSAAVAVAFLRRSS